MTRQWGISLSYLTGTREHLTAHYLSLNAQEIYYAPVCSPHTAELWLLPDFYYTTGVCGSIRRPYIRRPLCVSLHRTRPQAAAREASAASPRMRKMNLTTVGELGRPPPLFRVSECSWPRQSQESSQCVTGN